MKNPKIASLKKIYQIYSLLILSEVRIFVKAANILFCLYVLRLRGSTGILLSSMMKYTGQNPTRDHPYFITTKSRRSRINSETGKPIKGRTNTTKADCGSHTHTGCSGSIPLAA